MTWQRSASALHLMPVEVDSGPTLNFFVPVLQSALDQLVGSADQVLRAIGDNYRFEETVSDMRRSGFESFCDGVVGELELRRRHTDYFGERCRDALLPETFDESLQPAAHRLLDEEQWIIRIEAIARPLALHEVTFEQLQDAIKDSDSHFKESFLLNWNTRRDPRPAFSAFLGDLADDCGKADWPDRLRDRLGLAHYDPQAGPIPVAMMRYHVRDVLAECPSGAASITTPTVFDSEPGPYFFPAPKDVHFGRAMALNAAGDESSLQSEILHTRITYHARHLIKIGYVTKPLEPIALKELRNHHLLCLHMEIGRESFGEVMP